ncbi:MAG TPA: DnaT-like ssDNA-binding protein [Methylosinus sp.]|jgi:hypothetical protein|uniref:DnaT-like ssDNA-binding protein n=1 Tax=Methylosinus sp. TaxID=427 RepID=UPI002F9506B3
MLTVETGSGLPGADALASVANCDAYHAARGNAAWTGADADKEAAIRRATAYLSRSVTWAGLRTHGRAQALAWPRASCTDLEGYGIRSDEIPIEIVSACAELALIELETPNALAPVIVPSEAIKREVIGQIETEYANPLAGAEEHRAVSAMVRDLIAPFVCRGGGSPIVGTSYRV